MKKLTYLSAAVLLALSTAGFAATTAAISLNTVQPLTCMGSSITYTGTSAWYTQANITLTNNCGSAQDLANALLSFNSNYPVNGSVWGTYPYINNTQAVNQGQVVSMALGQAATQWNPSTLAAGASFAVQFGLNLDGSNKANIANVQVVAPNGPPTPTNGAINVNFAANSAMKGATAVVNVTGPTTTSVSNSTWVSPQQKNINNLTYGSYTLTANPVNSCVGTVSPGSVVISNSTPVNVSVAYNCLPPATLGALQVTMPSAPIANIPLKTLVQVKNANGQVVQSQSMGWNSAYTFSNLPSAKNGVPYTVVINSGNSLNSGTQTATQVTGSGANRVNVMPSPLAGYTPGFNIADVLNVPVTINVSSSATTNASITLSDSYNNTFDSPYILNGVGSTPQLIKVPLPLGDSIAITATSSTPGLVATVAPSGNFNPSNGNNKVVVSFAAAPVSKGLLVGYLDLSAGNNPSIIDGVSHGYNMIIIGWGQVSGDTVNVWPSTISSDPNLAADIASAHKQGVKVLLTFGGANNTFLPPANATAQDAQTIANGMLALAKTYGFDGFDFDLESTTVPYSLSFMEALIGDLKAANPSLLITGAPQVHGLVGWGWNYMGFAPVANGPDWNALIAADLFDYIFSQDYNQGGGAGVTGNAPGDANYGQVMLDSQPGFLAGSYEAAMNGYTVNNPGPGAATAYNAPAGWTQVAFNKLHTKLVMGVPAVLNDWRGAAEGVADPAKIVAQLNCLTTGNGCTSYKPSSTYPVAGLMTWSIAGDQYVNWGFSNGVKVCVLNGQCQ